MIQLASGDLCTTCDSRGELNIIDFKTHQKIKTIPIAFRAPKCMSMTVLRDGRLSVCISFQRSEHDDDRKHTVLLYDLERGECEQVLDEYAYDVLQLSDGRLCTSLLGYVTILK
jgi:hypothetical protein